MADTGGKLTGYLRTATKILAVLIVALMVTLLFNFAFIAAMFAYFLATGGSVDTAITLLQDSFSSIWFMLGTTVTQEIAWIIVPAAFVVLDRKSVV